MFNLEYFRSKIDEVDGIPTLKSSDDLRSPEVKRDYKESLVIIKKEWVSVEDYILVKKFGYDCLHTTRKAKLTKYAFSQKTENDTYPISVLKKSDFKYSLIDCDFHYILWVNSNDTQVIKKALEIQKAKFAGTNYVYFQNEPKNQSVKRLTHFHFLCKL